MFQVLIQRLELFKTLLLVFFGNAWSWVVCKIWIILNLVWPQLTSCARFCPFVQVDMVVYEEPSLVHRAWDETRTS